MNIFYTTNDAFVPQVATSMCSLFENNKEASFITVFIAAMGVSEDNKRKLHEFAQGYGREVHFVEIDNLETYIDFDFDTAGWNSIVLARLILDKLLPQDVERVLYLDGDTLVYDNLDSLWQTDMGTSVIGAVIEPTAPAARRESLQMGKTPYCNAGVLLIDLKKWRAQKTGRKILAYYKEKNGKLFANDQDAINGALTGEIYLLPPRYNYCNTFDFYPYRTLAKIVKPASYVSEEVYNQTKAHPAIIHYLGEERPWRKGNTHRYACEYQKFLGMTPWSDTPMQSGWETYFKCFKLFNTLTKPFPMLRYKIIDSLIPAVMRHRAKQLKKQS